MLFPEYLCLLFYIQSPLLNRPIRHDSILVPKQKTRPLFTQAEPNDIPIASDVLISNVLKE